MLQPQPLRTTKSNSVQNSRTLRRLAADQGALQSQPLPPNYLFPPGSSDADDLTQLDILLAGPTHTPFAAGVWKLHLSIPSTYPQQPPTANFRTSIFHPNVDPQTGGVCVETLKRDWDSKLTLRDVLVTISCLLIQPNPDSALNAEAGSLIQEDYAAFAKRAELMTSIHAVVPKALRETVREAQMRGQEVEEKDERSEANTQVEAPRRRRIATVRQRGTVASRSSDGSPNGGVARRRQQVAPVQPLVFQPDNDDVFGTSTNHSQNAANEEDDSSMIDANQENDESRSPTKAQTPRATTPRRLPGTSVPLGELTLEDIPYESSDDEYMEQEYPPSPRKSPSKSPSKQHNPPALVPAESSRAAASREPNITPPSNVIANPLAEDSPFHASADMTSSPRKSPLKSNLFQHLFQPLAPGKNVSTPENRGGIFKKRSPSSSEKKRLEAKRRAELDAKLWELCGRDIKKWNRGEFGGEVLKVKAKRW
jgi:ubiquitin-conjugating enzyme E2 S